MIHTMQDPRFVVFNGGTACKNVGFEREIVAIMKYLHAHRLALLVQRFHRHKFITAPGPKHIAGNVIVLPQRGGSRFDLQRLLLQWRRHPLIYRA